jgi:DNA-binding XRE family transcriptional regulator
MSTLDDTRVLLRNLSSPDLNDDAKFLDIVRDFRLVADSGDFARKFGMSRSTITRWENGETVPHPALRPRIFGWLRKRAVAKIAELEIAMKDLHPAEPATGRPAPATTG